MNLPPKAKHLYYRAAFCPVPVHEPTDFSIDDLLIKASGFKSIDTVTAPDMDEYVQMGRRKKIAPDLMKSRQKLIELNASWINRFSDTDTLLREKTTLFWHDHFACRVPFPFLAQQLNNTIRRHALGKFGDLLMAVSKEAAMLQFLNNRQNKKDSPNENFAREVLELFTLGRGYYSEPDIRNAARAFTGWSFNPATGQYAFKAKAHDFGPKSFRGKTGNFTGEDIIAMVLEDRQTAKFITEKIWHYFVSTDSRDAEIINTLADKFYASNYAIDELLRNIFSSDWFYSPQYVGNRIKSPVELLAGIQLQTRSKFQQRESVLIQRVLGQVLFFPPNVGGWPSGKEWIDSSSLTFRLSLPGVLLKNMDVNVEPANDGDANNAANDYKMSQKLTLPVDWTTLAASFVKNTTAETLDVLEDFLLARPATAANKKIVSALAERSSGDAALIQNICTGLMSLPEYQLS